MGAQSSCTVGFWFNHPGDAFPDRKRNSQYPIPCFGCLPGHGSLRVNARDRADRFTRHTSDPFLDTQNSTDQTINSTAQLAATRFVQAARRNSLDLDDALSAIRSAWTAR